MNQPNVLVLSDEGRFSHALLTRWQQERVEPAFTVTTSDVLNGPSAPDCDVAIVGGIRAGRLTPVLKTLDACSRPTICVTSQPVEALRETFPRMQFLKHNDGWEDPAVVLAVEILRRVEAVQRARRAEQATAKLQHQAALGRYMLEVRHGLNNALTSVLGNAELLLMNPEFAENIREQLETIHTMSLKMHEMLYRFSSLENEMHFREKQSQGEIVGGASATAVAGD